MNAMMWVTSCFSVVWYLYDSCRFHHGAPTDFDDWAALQKDQPGADGWTHEEFYK